MLNLPEYKENIAALSQFSIEGVRKALDFSASNIHPKNIGIAQWKNNCIITADKNFLTILAVPDHLPPSQVLDTLSARYMPVFRSSNISTNTVIDWDNKPVTLKIANIRYKNKDEGVILVSKKSTIYNHNSNENSLHYYDSITGLPNRLLFQEKLDIEIGYSRTSKKKVCVILMDLDRFKVINDMYGHVVGDAILSESSKRLRKILSTHNILARLGGDEFGIIIPDLEDPQICSKICKSVIRVLSKPFKIEREEIFLTPSIGIAMFPLDTIKPDQLLAFAELAMYEAKKKKGGNTYIFYSDKLGNSITESHILEKDLRKAVKQNELEVYYQPKITISNFEIVGIEALVRWKHSEHGMISPTKFIPIAENSGLVGKIGEYVLYTACKQTRVWQQEGLPNLKLAVNVSVKQLKPSFITKVQDILRKTKFLPQYLELEITESDFVIDNSGVLQTLTALKKLGISISIDDFGTGYSSLSRITHLPIDGLKIDKSFIDTLNGPKSSHAIIKAIITLAKSLKLEIVAEGIESEQQIVYLKKYKNLLLQGYKFSPPVSRNRFGDLLKIKSLYQHLS